MEETLHQQQIYGWRADQAGGRSGGVTLSADKTSATADSTDAVTVSLKYTLNGSGVSGKTVAWTSTGGSLSVASSQTGSAGGATVKLTSDAAGTFTVTGTVDGVAKTTEEITFTAPSGE
ncbi:TPA: Ig-like domain-containing protein [Kluyvera ascorbata]|uniref:Ig-like domain-containing protein n=1 Tax=Kluyvera ascorbata TaxID=51288 RepID=UPI002803B42A|nr:Ig-like domain-containing protein [Kluyvera ascorbata]MDU3913800.1 Ig-like domain-containing protein [Kluyvera ascorbata]HDG1683493.1 Ig-like domain-containing protein [Kluyvera ascorbata]HED3067116.1 Ig-like domain-containing protein [Kluyvera ascorbata]